MSIADAPPVVEGGTAAFPVTLSVAVDHVITVSYATADGTARAGLDYTTTTGTLRLEPGTTRRTIEVVTRQDAFVESDEAFTVRLSDAAGAAVEDDSGTGTILDDDLVDGLPTLEIADATPVSEGGTAAFAVTLNPASEQVVSVSYRTRDDTAAAGLDYTAADGTLRFEPGETTRTIAVTTLTDELVEGPERFTVELSDSVAAVMTDATGVGTITETAERIATVNRTVLPELGRALAFSAATCRFDRGLSGPTNRGGARGRAGYLSLSHGLTSDRLTSAPPTFDSPTSDWPGSDPRLSPMREGSTLERALGDSSFLMPMQDEEGGPGRLRGVGLRRLPAPRGRRQPGRGLERRGVQHECRRRSATRRQHAGGAVRLPVEGLVRLPRGRFERRRRRRLRPAADRRASVPGLVGESRPGRLGHGRSRLGRAPDRGRSGRRAAA